MSKRQQKRYTCRKCGDIFYDSAEAIEHSVCHIKTNKSPEEHLDTFKKTLAKPR